jgi:hypothetical protein
MAKCIPQHLFDLGMASCISFLVFLASLVTLALISGCSADVVTALHHPIQ